MARYVGLLRGINVGGNRKVPMADLQRLCSDAGHTEVTTYIQSGNVVFSSGSGSKADIEEDLEQRLAAKFGFDVPVTLRTKADLAKIVKADPFGSVATDRARVFVLFLKSRPTRTQLGALGPTDAFAPELFEPIGNEVHLFLPNGMGRTKLGQGVIERKLGIAGTARNWNTVTKLADLA